VIDRISAAIDNSLVRRRMQAREQDARVWLSPKRESISDSDKS